MKKILLAVLTIACLISGICFTHFAIVADNDYKNAQVAIDFAGDNSKAMQKANDTKQHIDEYKKRWVAYWVAAAVSYFFAVVFFVLIFVKRSKNVRE